MPQPWTRRRLGWPGLVVLLLALAAALTWLIVTEERADSSDVIPRGPYIGALPEVLSPTGAVDAAAPSLAWPATPRAADPTGRDAVYDPHRADSEADFPVVGDGGTVAPFAPVVWVARVEASPGAPAVDTPCEVRVLPVNQPPFNCVARVMCAGEVLYPNPSQSRGYLVCEIRESAVLRASDRLESDGDPQLELDIAARRAEVEGEGRHVRVVW
ncbi:MAG: hypothetical protein AB8I08_05895 [Sandaracinaceae bacterium]